MRRKRRTREHIIADLGVHLVEGVVLECGWTAERFDHDYGYDLSIYTYDAEGYAEAGALLIQVKATESLLTQSNDEFLSWTLNVRDLRLWREEVAPVILIVVDVLAKNAYWLYIQEAFSLQETLDNRLYIRCRISRQNRLTTDVLAELRQKKQALLDRLWEV